MKRSLRKMQLRKRVKQFHDFSSRIRFDAAFVQFMKRGVILSENSFFTRKRNIILLATLVAALWGSAFPCVKIGYSLFSVDSENLFSCVLYAGIRFTLAGIIALIISVFMNKKLVMFSKKSLPYILPLGFFQTSMQYLTFYIGLYYSLGVQSAILDSTSYVVFMAVFSAVMMKGKDLSFKKTAGCLLGIFGAVITLSGGSVKFTFIGDGCIILSALFFAVGSLISKKIPKDLDAVSLNGWQLLFGGVILIAAGIIGGGQLSPDGISAYALMFYMALISSCGFVIWTLLLRHNPAEEITVFNLLVPLFGTILSGVFLGEKFLTLANMLALLCVCAGIYLVNSGDKRKYKS